MEYLRGRNQKLAMFLSVSTLVLIQNIYSILNRSKLRKKLGDFVEGAIPPLLPDKQSDDAKDVQDQIKKLKSWRMPA